MDNPLVSVIIPVYSVEKYIRESLQSIVNQTYDNIEIILVDDGTTDNSIKIAEKILESGRFSYKVIIEENKGLPGARNTGLKEIAGDYVCFIDSDDIVYQDHIFNSVKALCESRKTLCYSDFEFTYDHNRWGEKTTYDGYEFFNKDKLFELFSQRKIRIHCCSLLIKKSLLGDNNLYFNEKLRFGEDVDFMWKLFSVTRGIIHVKQNSYKYLVRENSIMNSTTTDKWEIFINEFRSTIKSLELEYPEDKDIYTVVFNRTMLGLSRIVAKNTDYGRYKEFARKYNKKETRAVLRHCDNWKLRLMAKILVYDGLFYKINHSKYVW